MSWPEWTLLAVWLTNALSTLVRLYSVLNAEIKDLRYMKLHFTHLSWKNDTSALNSFKLVRKLGKYADY